MNETVTRAGARTSEFWFGMATIATVWLDGLPVITIPESRMLIVASLAGAYGAGRTWLKQQVARATPLPPRS